MHEGSKHEPRLRLYARLAEAYSKRGEDGILHDAPYLVIALTPKEYYPQGRDNAHFCLTYAELFAPSLGLGSCWAGFFEAAAQNGGQALLEALEIPEDMMVGGAIMLGYPKYFHKQMPERNPLDVTFM